MGGPAQALYGFALTGLQRAVAPPAPADWARWHLRMPVGVSAPPPVAPEPGRMTLSSSEAVIPLGRSGQIRVRRAARTITFEAAGAVSPDAVVHPGIVPVAATIAHWAGRSCLHGGAVLVGDRAWGILGDREAGKSTLLALLAANGLTIVADDLLVFDADARCYGGPAAVDLRADAARRLGGRPLGRVGARDRFRLDTPLAPSVAPLAGFVWLTWGEETAVAPVPPAERLELLAAQTQMPVAGPALLGAATLPMVTYARARDFDRAQAGVRRLLEHL